MSPSLHWPMRTRITGEKMLKCVWVRSSNAGSKSGPLTITCAVSGYVGVHEDKDARGVVKETLPAEMIKFPLNGSSNREKRPRC